MDEHNTPPIQFRTVLRIRPLLKREREEHVLVEPLTKSTAVLRQLPSKVALLSPSSALVLQTLSPETARQAHDVEFRFDYVLSSEANQDKSYFSIGHPIAQSSMESLKMKGSEGAVSTTTNLVIATGLEASGKTYTCWGDDSSKIFPLGEVGFHKRKSQNDGLVPRILDSLFAQSKHRVCMKNNAIFAVNLLVIEVSQNVSKPDSCQINDLLQDKLPSASASAERSFPFHGRRFKFPPTSRDVSRGSHAKLSATDDSGSRQSERDWLTSLLIEGPFHACTSAEEARSILQNALSNNHKRKHSRRQSHVLISMQPAITDRSGTAVAIGGRIIVLDMAGVDYQSAPGAEARTSRLKDTPAHRSDAHAALMHCLRALICNQCVQTEKMQDKSENDESNNSDTEATTPSARSHNAPRKVPYLQHKVTTLLQPLFSPMHSEDVQVTLVLTASPGHSDYAQKKEIMAEITNLYQPPLRAEVTTGLCEVLTPIARTNEKHTKKASSMMIESFNPKSEGGDEASLSLRERPNKCVSNSSTYSRSHDRHNSKVVDIVNSSIPTAHVLRHASSMNFSESSSTAELVHEECFGFGYSTLPPPVAPDYDRGFRQHSRGDDDRDIGIWSPGATAPYEDAILPSLVFPAVVVVDFPGVALEETPKSSRSAIEGNLSRLRETTTSVTASYENGDDDNTNDKPSQQTIPIAHVVEMSHFADPAGQRRVHRTPLQPSTTLNVKLDQDHHSVDTVGDNRLNGTAETTVKFPYIGSIQKVVHATKQTGQKVMEKMTSTATAAAARCTNFGEENSSFQETSDVQLRHQLTLIQLDYNQMKEENAKLRQANESLQHELDSFRAGLSKDYDYRSTGALTGQSLNGSSSGLHSDVMNHVGDTNVTFSERQRGDDREDADDNVDKNDPKDFFDNPLFHHMAQIRSGY